MSSLIDYLLRFFFDFISLEFLVDLTVKGSIVLSFACLIAFLWRRPSASVRHYILALAIAGILVMPLFIKVTPKWEVSPLPTVFPQPETSLVSAVDTHRSPISEYPTVTVTQVTPTKEAYHWSSWLKMIWWVGAICATIKLLVGKAGLLWILFRASPVRERAIIQLAARCKRRIGVRRKVFLLFSSASRVPFAYGIFRPGIVLPQTTWEWSAERLEMVLLHEMAHLKRADILSTTLARMTSIIYWFNPLFWIVQHQLAVERERACDDLVLATGTRNLNYAVHLLEIGRSLGGMRRFAAPEVGMAHTSNFGGRIMAILNQNRNRESLTFGKMLLVGILAATLVFPLAGISSQAKEVSLRNVTPAERQAIIGTLMEFYDALSIGEDYNVIRDRFLTADYFDRPELTMENRDRREWDNVRDNMMQTFIRTHHIGPPVVKSRIKSIRREDDKYIVTQELDLINEGAKEKDRYVVKSLEHELVFAQEDGWWKIARYNDGVSVMQMDVDNPYGPIYLIWVKDLSLTTTPLGPAVFKIFPGEYRVENQVCIAFRLEDK